MNVKSANLKTVFLQQGLNFIFSCKGSLPANIYERRRVEIFQRDKRTLSLFYSVSHSQEKGRAHNHKMGHCDCTKMATFIPLVETGGIQDGFYVKNESKIEPDGQCMLTAKNGQSAFLVIEK